MIHFMRSIAAAVAVVLLAAPALAATRTWSGTAGNLWSNPANWGGTLPVAGDDLLFPAAANKFNTNDLPAGTVFHSITFTDGSYSLGGNAIGLSSGVSSTAAGTVNTFNFATTTLTAPQTWSSIPFALLNAGATNVNGQTLTLANQDSLIINSISGGGAIVQAGSGRSQADLSTFTGTITVNGGQFFLFSGSAGNLAVTGGELVIQSSNVGAISATGGTFTLAHQSSSGSLTLGPGAIFNGALSPTPASMLTVNGTVTLGNATLHLHSFFPAAGPFVLIDNDGVDAVNGTFLGLPDGGIVNVDGTSYRISYAGGTGNDVTLTAVGPAVPLLEPGALALLALALAATALVALRR